MNQWHHAPVHILDERGAYMVTCGTYQKQHHLNTPERLSLVQSALFEVAQEFKWRLQAWAVMSNHYHFIALSPENPESLSKMLLKLHSGLSLELNRLDNAQGRRVWYQYYDKHITYPASYFPRLKYVHQNPAHHGLVKNARNYPWCSASWFARDASASFRKTVESFKTNKLNVLDDFEVIGVGDVNESGGQPPHSKSAVRGDGEHVGVVGYGRGESVGVKPSGS